MIPTEVSSSSPQLFPSPLHDRPLLLQSPTELYPPSPLSNVSSSSPVILAALSSPPNSILVFTTLSKQLHLHSPLKSQITIPLPKRATCLLLRPEILFVATAVGDIYMLRLPLSISTLPPPSLGHFSAVTALAATSSLLASGDREGRIRVSRLPDTHVIETFCLGHEKAISCLRWMEDGKLVSGARDGVRVWSAEKCVGKVELGSGFVTGIVPRGRGVWVSTDQSAEIHEIVISDFVNCTVIGKTDFGGIGALVDAGKGVWVGGVKGGVLRLTEEGSGFKVLERIGKEGEEVMKWVEWLKGVEKKKMVEGWKGKKRKWVEVTGEEEDQEVER